MSGPVVVVDYGVNNVGSVVNMLSRLEVTPVVATRPDMLEGARAIVLPGIGAFDAGVTSLERAGLFAGIRAAVAERGVPILGICLGMQLLTRGSEEGSREGLALVPATTRRFSFEGVSGRRPKIPHMGWNATSCLDPQLFEGIEGARFYYVHSYHVVCDEDADVAARCTYGGGAFTAALRRGRVVGTQFHPEKSHRFGKAVLSNFLRLAADARSDA